MKNKNLRKHIRIDTTRNGVTVWIDGCWIIDASTILEDGTVSISPKLKKFKDKSDKINTHYIIKGIKNV